MKFIRIALCLFVSSVLALGENVIIGWDNNDPIEEVFAYKLWTWKSGTPVLVLTVATNFTPALSLKGKQSFTVTAVNMGGESPHSTNLVFTAKPNAPVNLNKR